MIRIWLALFIVTCLLLPGCTQSNDVYTDERFYTDDYLPDYDVSMEYQAGTGNLDKEGSVYYVCAPQTQAWIHYYDDETKREGILCGKPECTHEEMTCNAFIQSPMGIQVYDHHLYWLSGATQIWRMNLQGTERELVRNVEYAQSGSGLDPYFAVHRGYIYSRYMEGEVENGKHYYRIRICQYSLTDPEAPGKEIFSQRYTGLPDFTWLFKGNTIYYFLDTESETDGIYQREIWAYHIIDEQLKLIWSGEEDWYTKGYVIDEDEKGVVILEAEEFQENKDLYIRKSYIDFESGTKESGDGDSDFSEYKLYDYDFNLIREGKVPDNKLYCAGIDDTGILLDEHYGSDTRDYYKVYRIPTTAEGEEELLINVVRDISMFNVHGE